MNDYVPISHQITINEPSIRQFLSHLHLPELIRCRELSLRRSSHQGLDPGDVGGRPGEERLETSDLSDLSDLSSGE